MGSTPVPQGWRRLWPFRLVVLKSCPVQRRATVAAQLMLDGVDARPAAAHRLSASRLLHGLRQGAETLVAPVIIVMILTL